MYFRNFPDIYYIFDINKQPVLKVVKDVTTNVRIRKEILENITLFDEYDIKDGETPEIIAHNVYGSSQYHWVIMLCNQVYDITSEWPLSSDQLNRFIIEKYNLFPVTQWTYNNNVVTFTSPKHTLTVGSQITVSGTTSTTNSPNGLRTVTAITPDTVSIAFNSIPTGTFGVNNAKLTTTNREFQIKHYVKDGLIVDQGTTFATPVTYYEYEESINEQKRRIKLIDPNLLSNILSQFNSIL